MPKEVDKISTQVCVGCSLKNIQALLIPTIISSETADKRAFETKPIRSCSREFEIATSFGIIDGFFTNHECIPPLESAYLKFRQAYPKYEATKSVDEIRDKEYSHLQSNNHVCMDYFGFGLYSHRQYHHDVSSSSFRLSYMSANLTSSALYGTAEPGTLEFQIKNRIMMFLRIQDRDDYSVVFTASRETAFGLLAESYPFHVNKRLLTVYDHDNEGLNRMVESANIKGAKTMSALFKWPSLRVCSDELKTALMIKKKRKTPKEASAEGLFVFPVQSRVTGAKYSYQWISHAQKNGWHVLLDASAFGPKDMDSLGFSMFLPDFIICSFYKVYGEDPVGFGCLFIKKSVMSCLHTSSAARGIGMVRIVPICKGISPGPANDDIQDGLCSDSPDANVNSEILEAPDWGFKNKQLLNPRSFSGSVSAVYRGDRSKKSVIYITENEHFHRSDTESFTKTDFGSEPGRFCHPHPSSSYGIQSNSSHADVKYFKSNVCVGKYKRSSGKEEILEGIAELGEIEEENPFPNSEFMHSNGIEEHEESMHLGPLRENIRNKSTNPNETSGIGRQPQEEIVPVFTAPGNTRDTKKPYHGATLGDSPKYIQSERVNGNRIAMSSESQILFTGLDHADSLGLNRINIRLRYLINWLVNAFSKLCHPSSENLRHLVKIYGHKVKYSRGPSVAFNLYDWKGELVEPLLVQKLADRSNISMGYGVLRNIWFPEKYEGDITLLEFKNGEGTTITGHSKHQGSTAAIPVVSAALSFVTNFEDVYRLWAFVAKFLDADRCISLPNTFCQLHALHRLIFFRCKKLTELPESFGSLGALEKLNLEDVPKLKRLPDSFGQLNSLSVLKLQHCYGLTALPESFGNLSSLESLKLNACRTLQSLPRSFSQLSNLKVLQMIDCRELSSLPDKFGQLKSLKYLSIESCDGLKSLCNDFGCLKSLVAMKAVGCSQLEGEVMDSLVEVKSTMFLNITGSPMLIERWAHIKETHPLLLYSDMAMSFDDRPHHEFVEKMLSAVTSGERKCIHVDGGGKIVKWMNSFPSDSPLKVALFFTLRNLFSPSNGEALQTVRETILELTAQHFHVIYIAGLEEEEESEELHQKLLSLPEGVLSWMPPHRRMSKLFAYSAFSVAESEHIDVVPDAFHSFIVSLSMSMDGEGKPQMQNPKLSLCVGNYSHDFGGNFEWLFHTFKRGVQEMRSFGRPSSKDVIKLLDDVEG